MKPSRPKLKRFLFLLSNGGFILAGLLAMVPLGMSAVAHWHERQAREEFMALLGNAPEYAHPEPAPPVPPSTEPNSDGAPPPRPKDSSKKPAPAPAIRPPWSFTATAVTPPSSWKETGPETSASSDEAHSPASAPIIAPINGEKPSVGAAPKPTKSKKPIKLVNKAPKKWQLARLEIPAIGVDAIVKERTGSWRWTTGAAHEPGTARPGETGNCIIAAHRNMWDATFAKLPRLQPGDRVVLTTPQGRFTYKVDTSRNVQTKDKTPLQSTPIPSLTLYTCVLPYNAKERWVVQAMLTEEESKKPVRSAKR